jgi:uncharacterized membrane protein
MELIHQTSTEHIVIRRLTPGRIVLWMQLALRDLRRAAPDVLLYGALFVFAGYVLTFYLDSAPQVVLTMATLFLLVGPFLAIGIYDLARQIETRRPTEKLSLRHSLVAWRDNLQSFTLFAVLLAVLVFSWFRLSLLIFALMFDFSSLPSVEMILVQAIAPQNWPFMLVYLGSGFVFALLAFAASAFAVPMMLEREVDVVTAILTSMRAVQQNLMTMALWAAMIVLLTVIGLVTYFVGLLVVMPLIGLATWHAYRDTIAYE